MDELDIILLVLASGNADFAAPVLHKIHGIDGVVSTLTLLVYEVHGA